MFKGGEYNANLYFGLDSGVSHTGFDQSALFWRICKGLYEGYLKSNVAHCEKEFIAHALKQNDGNIWLR